MPDIQDLKIELLETLQRKTEALELMLKGARLVAQGGVEGIQEVAQTHPETILLVIESLAGVIESQHQNLVEDTETYLTQLDLIESLRAQLNK